MDKCPSCESPMQPVEDTIETQQGEDAILVGYRCTNKDCGYFEEIR